MIRLALLAIAILAAIRLHRDAERWRRWEDSALEREPGCPCGCHRGDRHPYESCWSCAPVPARFRETDYLPSTYRREGIL